MPGMILRSVHPFTRLLRATTLAALSVLAAAAASSAAERTVNITAPKQVIAGTNFTIPVAVATDFGRGERVGFFHGEYSTDSGKTWTGFCFESNLAASVTRHAQIKAGAVGSTVVIRVRVAFRDGAAGDVDYSGAAIKWNDTWEKWDEPPAKYTRIAVRAP